MKKGFTLIELLGVIALLGLLAAISIPIIDSSLNKARDGLSKTQEKQIIKGAEDYYAEHLGELPSCVSLGCTTSTTITLYTLQQAGYLPANIINEKTGSNYNVSTTKVRVTVKVDQSGEKNYTYSVE